jgi:hypothetical protein
LTYALNHPPFPTKRNTAVEWTATIGLGAIPTTYLGTILFAESFHKVTTAMLAKEGLKTAVFYAAIVGAQKAINSAAAAFKAGKFDNAIATVKSGRDYLAERWKKFNDCDEIY